MPLPFSHAKITSKQNVIIKSARFLICFLKQSISEHFRATQSNNSSSFLVNDLVITKFFIVIILFLLQP